MSKLDVGYGYTADGETYPLRGQGAGLMPRLEDVFDAFPGGHFLIDTKADLDAIPKDVNAYIWTDRVEAIT